MRQDAPDLDHLGSIHLDGSRRHLHPADVSGRFVTGRRAVYALLILIYLALPFWKVGGHPAVQLDIEGRRFHLFGSVFNAQDGFRIVFLLLMAGLGLLFVTAVWGRVWCGWACPQTVFLEGVYRRIERLIEGPREARIRLAAQAWDAGKVARKMAKHAAFLVVSLGLAHAFLALFVSLPATFDMVRHDPRAHWTAFLWVMAITGLLYFNFAWFREQLCVVICPYGRLQSALLDRDSMIIGYDRNRGEPRGKVSRGEREGIALPVVNRGDCVDCFRCVAVCPTGIDIRNGSQMECIGCAQCIDACDDVMARLGKQKGLVRYDSQRGLTDGVRRLLRPRVTVYGALFAGIALAFVLTTLARKPFEANLLRVQGAPFVLDEAGIRNQLELHVVNKNAAASTFTVTTAAPGGVVVAVPAKTVRLEPFQDYRLPLIVTMPRSNWRGPVNWRVTVHDGVSGQSVTREGRLLGPLGPLPPG